MKASRRRACPRVGLPRSATRRRRRKRKSSGPSPKPISPSPVRRWRPEYIPAYLSNGVIGLRAGPIPLIEGVAIVNGLAAVDPVEKGEGFAPGPYPIGGDVEIDGAKLSRRPGQTEVVGHAYDFASGERTGGFTVR